MTTTVVIDAHAGWPVKVVAEDKPAGGEWTERSTSIVKPNTKESFAVWDDRRLVIEEMPR